MSKSSDFNKLSVLSKSIGTISIRSLVVDSIETQRIIVPKVKAKVCISDNATQCFKIPEIEFSNCFPMNLDEGATPPHVITAFEKLNKNIDIIKNNIKPIILSGRHMDRIETILKKYLEEDSYNSYSDFFYKSDVITRELLSDRGSFRVISLYIVEPKIDRRQKHSKHKLVILFFDPYHLFIPSSDYGTKVYKEICNFSSNCNLLQIEK